jgi:hypothetical protein
MSKVLGAYGLLDFTILWSVLAWRTFRNLRTVHFFLFSIFSGRREPLITETADNDSVDTRGTFVFENEN